MSKLIFTLNLLNHSLYKFFYAEKYFSQDVQIFNFSTINKRLIVV